MSDELTTAEIIERLDKVKPRVVFFSEKDEETWREIKKRLNAWDELRYWALNFTFHLPITIIDEMDSLVKP